MASTPLRELAGAVIQAPVVEPVGLWEHDMEVNESFPAVPGFKECLEDVFFLKLSGLTTPVVCLHMFAYLCAC